MRRFSVFTLENDPARAHGLAEVLQGSDLHIRIALSGEDGGDAFLTANYRGDPLL